MKRWTWSFIAAGLMAGLIGGAAELCRAAEKPAAGPAAAPEWIKTEIYFGRDIPGGQEISRGAWEEFMDTVITPRFPKGLTVYDAYGQMAHEDGRIERQSTWVVAVVHPKDPAVDKAVQEIIEAFRKQFNRAQVMILSAPTAARFFAD
ncbi:MAG: DUF3574 domain-containing protein [PVC group bacterium]